jgi:sortase A
MDPNSDAPSENEMALRDSEGAAQAGGPGQEPGADRVRGSDSKGRNRSRWWRRAWMVIGVTAVGAGLFIGASIGWFYFHSHTVGRALVSQEKRAIRAAGAHDTSSPTTCAGFDNSASAPQGLLNADDIGLQGPVVAGVGDSQLDVAVGHVPDSAWPGQPGTTILAAHDVSYFSAIDHLSAGQRITFVTPCLTYVYAVTGHQIVAAGSPVYSSPSQSLLILETCYPLNALYITSQRYLVTAQYEGSLPTGQPMGAIAAVEPAPVVPAPASLSAQGLTMATNNVALGTLDIVGTPLPSWQQGPGPLVDEGAVLSEYFAAVRTVEQGRSDWWTTLSPTVPFGVTSVLQGATISVDIDPLNPVLTVQGDQLTGAQLTTTVRIAGGHAPGIYQLVVTMADTSGTLTVTGWSLSPSS